MPLFPMTIQIANADELAAVQAALIDGPAPAAAPATPIKPARAAKPGAVEASRAAALEAAQAAQAVKNVAAPATARASAADTAVTVTPAQIKAAADDLTLLANELGAHAQAVAILGEFGVKKMTEMPQSSIPEFHAKIKAAIAKLQPAAGAVSLV